MAPEQLFGEKDIDHRADIWALGIVLYEALTGVLPTQQPNVGQIIKLIITDAIAPLRERAPHLPEAILTLVDQMLTRDRTRRPADLRAVAEVLARFTDEPFVAITSSPMRGTSASESPPPVSSGGVAREEEVALAGGLGDATLVDSKAVVASSLDADSSLLATSGRTLGAPRTRSATGPIVGLGAATVVGVAALLFWSRSQAPLHPESSTRQMLPAAAAEPKIPPPVGSSAAASSEIAPSYARPSAEPPGEPTATRPSVANTSASARQPVAVPRRPAPPAMGSVRPAPSATPSPRAPDPGSYQ
jgi:serine/threonine-protein kinase